LLSSILVCIFALGLSLSAQTASGQSTPPDNTTVNKRDSGPANPTASQQKDNRTDLEITRQIRSSIAKDKGLSTYAKNVKIITQNGMVTLRGPVRSEEEKRSIETKANDVAGTSHVKSELEITAKQPDKQPLTNR
jgi:hyperosmotically inducible periplasmic protein